MGHLFAFIIVLLWSSLGLADQTQCRRTFEIGSNVPFLTKDPTAVQSISADLLQELKKRVPCTYTERNISLTKAAEDFKYQRLDLYAFAYVTDDWSDFTKNSVLYSVRRILLIDMKCYRANLSVQDYLKNSKINFAMMSGKVFFTTTPETNYLENNKRAVFVPYPDEVMDALISDKAQAAFTSATYYRAYPRKNLLDKKAKLIVVPENPMKVSLFYSKSRMSSAEIKMFDEAISKMKKEGVVQKIIEKYMGKDYAHRYYLF